MSGLGCMSGIPPPPTDWTSILASTLGGGAVGFLSSFLLEPAKKRFLKPKIEFDFPIQSTTDLQHNTTTPYISLIIQPKDPKNSRFGDLERLSTVRLLIKNTSNTFTAEGCRVFLTSIETRDNERQPWKTTEYKENNQIAWNEGQFSFAELDIYPATSRELEILTLDHSNLGITVRIQDIHFSFNYLFHSPIPPGRGWKFYLLTTGKNVSPRTFTIVLECISNDPNGISPLQFQINGCLLDLQKLITRNTIDPTLWEALHEGGRIPGGPI